jgi:nitrite reductase (NADH) small subunit
MTTAKNWQTICHKDDLVKHAGICALLENDQQIAIFLMDNDQVYSLANWDPFGKANVLYRGIVGDDKGELYVASPLYKQRFALNSGICLDDSSVVIASLATRLHQDQLQVQV